MCFAGDTADVWCARQVKAKTPHLLGCRRQIEPGETYERVGMLWEGSWETVRTCAHCQALVGWLVDRCGSYQVGAALDDIEEHIDPSCEPDIDPRDAEALAVGCATPAASGATSEAHCTRRR